MTAAEPYGLQALSQLDSQIAEVEDMLSYCNDVLNTGECACACACVHACVCACLLVLLLVLVGVLADKWAP